MARGTVVKQEQREDKGSEQKPNKRRCVQSACQPCRKRKSKCDGGLPVCATCTAVYKTPCFYDAEGEARRSKHAAGPKHDSSVFSQTASATAPPTQPLSAPPSNDNAEFLLNSIRTLPEHEVFELIQQIRKEPRLDLASLADSWRKTVTFPPNGIPSIEEPQSLEGDLSMLLGKPARNYSGESRYFGHTSGLSLIPEDESYIVKRSQAVAPEKPSPTWTTVTDDIAFVERLLDLYFRWSHTFYVIFSRECFYKDFRSGRQKYCSSLLVNAILSFACHYTDEPAARTDPSNPRTAGDHFFEEARRLLHEDESPSLTTTQAMCILAMREPSMARDSSGFMYMGRCMRMAIELGLHLNNSVSPAMHTPSEIEVRKVTFWGCFTVDTVWSICVGRISQLPRAAITLDKPILDEAPAGLDSDERPASAAITTRMFLQEFSVLSELINDNNYMYFAPKERFTSRRLLECYDKYQAWYRNLPQKLRLEGQEVSQPHIIVLHMLYYTAVVHLFRPMLKVDLIHSNVRPRDTCIDAANKIAELMRLYRTHYSMRACQLVISHILLSANIVHLLYSTESQQSYINLVEGLNAMEDMTTCHYFAKRGLKILFALSKVWKLRFPEELAERAGLNAKGSQAGLVSPQRENFFYPQQPQNIGSRMGNGAGYSPITRTPSTAPSIQSMRRESLSMFTRPNSSGMQMPPHPATSSTAHSPVSSIMSNQPQHRGSISQSHNSANNSGMLTTYPTPTSDPAPETPTISLSAPTTHLSHQTSNNQSAHASQVPTPTNSAETLFWTPIPGTGVPILPRTNYQVGPMDLDAVLGNVNEWDKFSRDGFKMSDQWTQDSMVAGTVVFSGRSVGEQGNGYEEETGVSNGVNGTGMGNVNGYTGQEFGGGHHHHPHHHSNHHHGHANHTHHSTQQQQQQQQQHQQQQVFDAGWWGSGH